MCDSVKSKVCSRCGGSGFVTSPVAHCGISGLCFKCDGQGKLYWTTGEQQLAYKVKNTKKALESLVQDGLSKKAEKEYYMAKVERQLAKGMKASLHSVELCEESLEALRGHYRQAKKDLADLESGAVKLRGQWVSAKELLRVLKAGE